MIGEVWRRNAWIDFDDVEKYVIWCQSIVLCLCFYVNNRFLTANSAKNYKQKTTVLMFSALTLENCAVWKSLLLGTQELDSKEFNNFIKK